MKERLIVALDGHDGTGKTTLAKMLADQLGGVALRPFSGDTGAKLLEAGEKKDINSLIEIGSNAIENSISSAKPSVPIVLDRAWVTVASFVHDEPEFFSAWHLWIPTTICWANLETSINRLNKRINSNGVEHQFEEEKPAEWHECYLEIYWNLAIRFKYPLLRTDQYDVPSCLLRLQSWVNKELTKK